jgi:uncharacterized protein (UPF0332 family)
VAFDWHKYLDLAKKLHCQPEEEAQRSSVSRAYYSVFCTARNHLKKKGMYFPQKGEEHKLVWDRFLNARRECRELGLLGDRLFRRRKEADYDDQTTKDFSKEAEAAIADADEFFTLLNVRPNCP